MTFLGNSPRAGLESTVSEVVMRTGITDPHVCYQSSQGDTESPPRGQKTYCVGRCIRPLCCEKLSISTSTVCSILESCVTAVFRSFLRCIHYCGISFNHADQNWFDGFQTACDWSRSGSTLLHTVDRLTPVESHVHFRLALMCCYEPDGHSSWRLRSDELDRWRRCCLTQLADSSLDDKWLKRNGR